jgi:PiT family inorganic phosphate transporter
MPSPSVALVVVIIGIALLFDFTNGFHDSANSISTVVSTRVLSPSRAVVFAAFFNFIAAFGFGVLVASTISKIINLDVVPAEIVPFIVLAALVGAIGWNLITWYAGLPTSSSHALIGGLTGAGISAAGVAAVKLSTVAVVAEFMVISPIIGMVVGFLFMVVVLRGTRNLHREKADHYFRRLQLVSAGAYSFSHGTNDAQKTMGIITPLLFSIGYLARKSTPTTSRSRSG